MVGGGGGGGGGGGARGEWRGKREREGGGGVEGWGKREMKRHYIPIATP